MPQTQSSVRCIGLSGIMRHQLDHITLICSLVLGRSGDSPQVQYKHSASGRLCGHAGAMPGYRIIRGHMCAHAYRPVTRIGAQFFDEVLGVPF